MTPAKRVPTPAKRRKPPLPRPRPVDPKVQRAIRLPCAYCRDRLEREQTVFCGSCLAPHHAGCFAEHGRCSAPGCLHTEVVRAGDTSRSRRAGAWIAAAALLGALGVVAASLTRPSAPQAEVAAALAESEPVRELEPVGELEAARRSALLRDALDRNAEAEAARETERSRDDGVRQQLETGRVTIDFEDTPVMDALDFLRDLAQLNVVVEADARDLIAQEQPRVSLRLRDISLGQALSLILSCHDNLDYVVERGVVAIGVECIRSRSERVLEAYDVRDILSGETRQRGGFAFDGDALIELIEQVVGEDLGGGSIELAGGMLAARQPEFVHRQLVELLDYLRHGAGTLPAEPAWIAQYREVLATRLVNLDAPEVPLNEVVPFLQELTGLNLALSPEVDGEIPVTFHVEGVPLAEALAVICEQTGLATTFADETLVFAAPETAQGTCALRILDVSDLTWLEPDDLVVLVRSGVGEDAWDVPAGIWAHRGQLIVNQTATTHDAIEGVLAKLRVSRATADGNLPRAE